MTDFWYKHYKGGMYSIIGSATHTETEEELVVYMDMNRKIWVRPAEMFFGKVEINGTMVRRFVAVDLNGELL